MKQFLIGLFFLLTEISIGQGFQLTPVASNLRRPVDISHAGDNRLFITEKDGTITILNVDGTLINEPYLDIRMRVNAFANERGLLGLAFHPEYHSNGYFYVHYTNTQGNSVISRFKVSNNNPDRADASSEKILLTVTQPFNNHNAGDLNFGPDGYLYIGMGDGGNGGDPGNRSQNPKNLLGKMLRIDVNHGDPYSIPDNNPFVGNVDTLEEIWSLGLRNPWRFSFDRLTGDMWIADVGQNAWEEINMEPTGTAGLNYGWRCYEGNAAFNLAGCKERSHYTFPVHVYPNRFDVGCSVTGGYVYRGTQNPSLKGKYIYTDFCTGIFWALRKEGDNWINEQLADLDNQDFVSFGEDVNGELYVAGLASGNIYKVSDGICSTFANQEFETILVQPDCYNNCTGQITIAEDTGGLNFSWYDNTEVSGPVRSGLCSGMYTVNISDLSNCSTTRVFELVNPPADSLLLTIMNDTLHAFGTIADNYDWYLNGELITVTSHPFLVPTQNGAYSVQVANANECLIRSNEIVFMLSNTKDEVVSQKIILYGNPVTDFTLRWHYPGSSFAEAYILNSNGVFIEKFKISAGEDGIYTKTVHSLPAGTYILITGNNALRFIILH